jgi:hypothetical protein
MDYFTIKSIPEEHRDITLHFTINNIKYKANSEILKSRFTFFENEEYDLTSQDINLNKYLLNVIKLAHGDISKLNKLHINKEIAKYLLASEYLGTNKDVCYYLVDQFLVNDSDLTYIFKYIDVICHYGKYRGHESFESRLPFVLKEQKVSQSIILNILCKFSYNGNIKAGGILGYYVHLLKILNLICKTYYKYFYRLIYRKILI